MREALGNGSSRRAGKWAVVLAGGAGTRLARLTSGPGGDEVPKQFWSLLGGRSLLGDAIWRAERLVPRDRIVVVVAEAHRMHWQRELADLPPRNVLVQPSNRGTAAGLVLPVLSILARDPHATIAVLPSDHFVADEELLGQALSAALARAARSGIVLVGIEPDAPETGYGWILPEGEGTTSAVRAFVEKPPIELARVLMERGALWNSFLIAADGQTLLERVHRRLPALTSALCDAFPAAADREGDAIRLEAAYARLPVLDFSRDVLQGHEQGLLLRRARACGWTDLGTPERVVACLQGLGPRQHSRPDRATPWILADAVEASLPARA